jgi:hypothetical protein
MRPLKHSLVLLAVVLLSAACGGSGPAAKRSSAPVPQTSNTARVTIITPANGQVIRTPTVHIKVRLTGAKPASPAATQALPGYIHTYLDSKIVSIEPVPSNDDVTPQTIDGVKPGHHLLKVEFVGPDHLPFRPPVTATVTFTAK